MVSWCKKVGLISLLIIITSSITIVNAAPVKQDKIVVAIDAGHGGKDPGAIGQNGLKEKVVNFAVAKELYNLLANDSRFIPVLTRTGDYFISVPSRSDIARSKNAHIIVSIHADAALNRKATGASVWVLSNKRADSELGRLLEQQEKQSELLGGGGDALGGDVNPYVSHAVIDLQFSHSQRVGYELATSLLSALGKVGTLHKRNPEHASLGILRSPDIPSVLVEVGFISNLQQEKSLNTGSHQTKLAKAIYLGVISHFQKNPIQIAGPDTGKPVVVKPMHTASAAVQGLIVQGSIVQEPIVQKPIVQEPIVQKPIKQNVSENLQGQSNTAVHIVKQNETLFSISRQYQLSVDELRSLNGLSSDNTIKVGQSLKVNKQSVFKSNVAQNTQPQKKQQSAKKIRTHKIVKGDSLSSIAYKYKVSVSDLKKANKITNDKARLDQILKIPE